MIIKTETELVRYIRHHIAGSEYQDVQAVKEFIEKRVQERTAKLQEEIQILTDALVAADEKADRLTDPEEK